MTNKTVPVPKKLFSVAWVPDIECKVFTAEEVINVGGRIIEGNFSKLGAEEVERCLNLGAPMDGLYITVQ